MQWNPGCAVTSSVPAFTYASRLPVTRQPAGVLVEVGYMEYLASMPPPVISITYKSVPLFTSLAPLIRFAVVSPYYGSFIILASLVAIRDRAATSHAFLHPGLEYSLDFVACIFGIPLVHDVQERGKVIFGRIGTINAVVDSDKTHSLFREHDFGVVSDLQIITTKTG